VGIIAFGSSHWAVVESLDQLHAEQGMAADYLRLRAYPFSAAVEEFIAQHERVYVVEQNRDGQMQQLIKMDISTAEVVKLRGVRHYSGHPLDSRFVTDNIVEQENAAQQNDGSPTSAKDGQIWATNVLQEQK
jgi:2-oxoglutarate ferredoxin oxidoreductase subunit alpha